MDRDELIQRARELREEGLSIRAIARQLSEETGERISKSRIERALKASASETEETEVETPFEPATPETFVPRPTASVLTSEAKQAMSQVAVAESELKRAQVEDAIRRQKRREELELREQELELRERSLELAIKEANLQKPSPEVDKQIESYRLELSEVRAQLEKIDKERERLERELHDERLRAEIKAMVDGKTGRSVFDLIAESKGEIKETLMDVGRALIGELRGLRETFSNQVKLPQPIGNPITPEAAAVAAKIIEDPNYKPTEQEKKLLDEWRASQPNPVVVKTERKLIMCDSCGTQQWLDLNKARLEYEPNKTLFKPCERCGYLMNVKPLVEQGDVPKTTITQESEARRDCFDTKGERRFCPASPDERKEDPRCQGCVWKR